MSISSAALVTAVLGLVPVPPQSPDAEPTPFADGTGKLYWIGNGFGPDAIRRSDLDGMNGEVVVGGLTFPQDVAVDRLGGKVYWSDFDTVRRANLDGTGFEVIVTTGGETRGVAVDSAGGKVYWTDYRNKEIQRADLDGANVEVLVTAGLNIPSNIALDVADGKMYWTDQNDFQVQRANLDGSNVEDLHANGSWGLALDLVNRKLYWGFISTIFRSDLDGSNAEAFFTTPVQLRGMAFDAGAGVLYFASLNPARVSRLRIADLHMESMIFGTDTPLGVDLDLTACTAPETYCTAGVSAGACQATLSATGIASASAATGFVLAASGVEGSKDGLYFFGANGRQANAWGNGSSFQCVAPPVKRAGLLLGSGTVGACDGAFAQDLNARWTARPAQNPGAGAVVQAQLWYRDPLSTSNRTTSLSNAIEFGVCP